MNRIRIEYHLDSRRGDVEALARGIALEQTLEVPESLVRAHKLEDSLASVLPTAYTDWKTARDKH